MVSRNNWTRVDRIILPKSLKIIDFIIKHLYNTVYVDAGRTVDYFVLKHQSPSGSNSTELFVTYEVYQYNYDE